MVVTIGQHRVGAFLDPTPADGAILAAHYFVIITGHFGTDFQVRAQIYTPTVRYKQYVKGSFKYNDVPQVQALHGGNLHPVNFVEDGNANGVYGVRGHNIPHFSTYQPMVDGHGRHYDLFIGNDTPADTLTCPSGTKVQIDLTFWGQIVDVGPPNSVYSYRKWHVRGTFFKP